MSAEADEYVSWALFAAVLRISNKAGWESPLWLSSGFNRDISLEPAATFYLHQTYIPRSDLKLLLNTVIVKAHTQNPRSSYHISLFGNLHSVWISGPQLSHYAINILPDPSKGNPNKRLYSALLWHIIHMFNLSSRRNSVVGALASAGISFSFVYSVLKLSASRNAGINSREQGTRPSLWSSLSSSSSSNSFHNMHPLHTQSKEASDWEIFCNSREQGKEEWKSQTVILILHFRYQWKPAGWASMGTTWTLISLYATQMPPVPPYSHTELVDLNHVAEAKHLPHYSVKIEVHPKNKILTQPLLQSNMHYIHFWL